MIYEIYFVYWVRVAACFIFAISRNTPKFGLLVLQMAGNNRPDIYCVVQMAQEAASTDTENISLLSLQITLQITITAELGFYLGGTSGKALRLRFQRVSFQALKIQLASAVLR